MWVTDSLAVALGASSHDILYKLIDAYVRTYGEHRVLQQRRLPFAIAPVRRRKLFV